MKLNENELFSLIDRSDEVNFEKNLQFTGKKLKKP